MKLLSNNKDVLFVIRSPAYRYSKQNVYTKAKYYMNDLVRHTSKYELSKSEAGNEEYSSVSMSEFSMEEPFPDEKIDKDKLEIERDKRNSLSIVDEISS